MRQRYQKRDARITEIRVFMLRRGLSMAKIGRALGISTTYVFQVLHNKRPAYHIRRRLVRELGFPEDLIAYEPGKRKAA